MPTSPDSARLRVLTIAAISLVALGAVATRLPLLGAGEFDWDEGVYWLSLQSMHAGNPLFTSVYSSQPPAFLLVTEPPWALLGQGIGAARAVMLAWGAVAIVAGGVIGWRLGGKLAAVAAAVALAVDPLMVHQSVVLQADGPATAVGLVAVALAVAAATGRDRRWTTVGAAAAGAALSVGLLTKLLDIAVLPALVVTMSLSADRWRLLPAVMLGGLLAAGAVLLPMHDSWAAMWAQSVGLHLDTRSSSAGISLASAMEVRWKFELLAVGAGVVGYRRHRRLVITGSIWIAGAAAAMAITHPLWPHHAVSVTPGLALLSGAGVSSMVTWATRLRSRLVPALVIAGMAVAAGVFLLSGLRGLHATAGLDVLSQTLAANTSPVAQVVGDEQFAQALAHRAAPPAFVDTSNTRMYAEKGVVQQLEAAADGSPPVCAVMFSSGRFAHLPGFAAWVSAHYPIRLSLGGDQYLFTVPGCR